jgi:metal-responsive CopG/Arc/MetJ family transcriptional regulator
MKRKTLEEKKVLVNILLSLDVLRKLDFLLAAKAVPSNSRSALIETLVRRSLETSEYRSEGVV